MRSSDMIPDVESRRESGALVLRVLGDWTRDMSMAARHTASEKLRSFEYAKSVLLEFDGLGFTDSWGEDRICEFCRHVKDSGGQILIRGLDESLHYGLAVAYQEAMSNADA